MRPGLTDADRRTGRPRGNPSKQGLRTVTPELTIKLNGDLATYRIGERERTIEVDSLRALAVHIWRSTELPRDTRLHFIASDSQPQWPNSYVALGDAVSWDF